MSSNDAMDVSNRGSARCCMFAIQQLEALGFQYKVQIRGRNKLDHTERAVKSWWHNKGINTLAVQQQYSHGIHAPC